MPSRIVPAQTSRSGPVRASVALRGLAGAAHACGNILQNPLQHSLKLRHSHRAVAAGLLWPGKIRYFASQNRARSTRRPSSSTGSARLQTCSVERDASRRRGRHNKNSDNGRERPQSQRLERLRPEPAPPPVRAVAKTHRDERRPLRRRTATTSTGSDRRGSGDRRHRADSRASDRRGSG